MFNEDFKHGKAFTVNADEFPFTTLDQVVAENGNKVLKVAGVFKYKAEYGERPVLIAEGMKINLPNHCLKDIEKILANNQYIDAINAGKYIDAINAGKCGFQPTQYKDKNGKERNSGMFIDI